MHRRDLSPNVGEDDLHAVVDGQLAVERHGEVMGYLAAYPDAADRVSAFFRQRVELAALRDSLADSDPGPQLATLEQQLCRVVRTQHRVRRALGTGGLIVALLAAASGWWLTAGHGVSGGQTRQLTAEAQPARVPFSPDLVAETSLAAVAPGDAAIVWLQAKLGGRTLKEPNLEALGLHFVGSNELRSAQGPAVRLLYTDGNGRDFNLFAGARHSGIESVPALVPEGHVAVTWQQDPLVFALVAPEGSSRLADIMRSANSLLDPAPIAADAAATNTGATGGKGEDSVPAAATRLETPATTSSRDGSLPAAATGGSKPL
jgi:anti-sigma factor RsiW